MYIIHAYLLQLFHACLSERARAGCCHLFAPAKGQNLYVLMPSNIGLMRPSIFHRPLDLVLLLLNGRLLLEALPMGACLQISP